MVESCVALAEGAQATCHRALALVLKQRSPEALKGLQAARGARMRANRGLTVGAGDHLRDSEGRRHRAPDPSEGALDVRNTLAPLAQSGLPEAGKVRTERGLGMLPERAPRPVLPEGHGAHVGSEGAEA
eukprot:3662488-Alexandrium_andersonii.AAC.1